MNISPAASLGLVGRETTFGSLQHLLNKKYNGRGIAIGYFKGSDLELCVQLGEKITWEEGHRVVSIVRDLEGLWDKKKINLG